MRKKSIILLFLLTFYLPVRTISTFSRQQKAQSNRELKKLIYNEMLNIPDNLENSESLKIIWYEGPHRKEIKTIISRKNILACGELNRLKYLISQEKNLIQNKIKRITDKVNQNIRNHAYEALKFKRTEHEIEDIVKKVELSADELIAQEYTTYDAILNKITDELKYYCH